MISFVKEKVIRILLKLLYPMIHPQIVERTAKWKEQSTDVNYEINPGHRQLEERPTHQYPNTSYRGNSLTDRFRNYGGGYSSITPPHSHFQSSPFAKGGKFFPFCGGWGEDVRRIARRKARTSWVMIARI